MVLGSSENQLPKSQSADWDAELQADWKWETGGYSAGSFSGTDPEQDLNTSILWEVLL